MSPTQGEIITIDTGRAAVTVKRGDTEEVLRLDSGEAFEAVSRAWLRCGWDVKYLYSFSWLGRPMLQLPDDMIRFQELVWKVRPDVIVETGVAHGGSLVFSAGLCRAIEKGRVIGIEKGLYPENREAIRDHILSDLITVVEGSSTAPEVVAEVKGLIKPGEKVLAVFDSNHSYDHVLAELRSYCDLIPVDSYIVVCDGIVADLVGAPRSGDDWATNNPMVAAQDFCRENPDFEVVDPERVFDESEIIRGPTYWKGGFLKRVASTN